MRNALVVVPSRPADSQQFGRNREWDIATKWQSNMGAITVTAEAAGSSPVVPANSFEWFTHLPYPLLDPQSNPQNLSCALILLSLSPWVQRSSAVCTFACRLASFQEIDIDSPQ